ncbi:type I pullulanase [Bifidobacterium choloepi]|uniref:Alpha-amylase n=1 Tax=Bifidobacterium choloepi TaxID=2614131 RepID=A0A6I5MXF7_9BIFI|nr:type I pullulanase [Bifidobacterium choloepi]NEG69258.1 type I pullulanase [Bifidobacterium choloepi]
MGRSLSTRTGWRATGLVAATATVLAGCILANPGTALATDTPSVDPSTATTATDVQVIAFQQTWNTIAKECTSTYGPEGVAYVEVSPPQESIQGTQWWTSYQPVSYKLDSKLGTEDEFKNMVQTCSAAGVGIIADVVLNQTTGSDVADGDQTGTAGTVYNGEEGTYPGFTGESDQYPDGLTSADFHDYENGKSISDYTNQTEVQEGRLSSMWDFDSESAKIQDIQSDYLAKLYDLGVTGFRIDAAKHINTDSLKAIKEQMATKVGVSADSIYWIQETIGNTSEAAGIQPYNYFQNGTVTQFDYKADLNQKFKGSIAQLKDLSTRLGDTSSNQYAIPSEDANVFVTNWDTARSEGALTYKDGAVYQLANAFMLAYDYGTPRLLSDYKWDNSDDGAPGATATSVPDVDMDEACSTNTSDWNCEQRWTSTRGMIGFHNTVNGTEVTDWQDDGDNNIAFSRGNVGFVAINNTSTDYQANYTTTLPDGIYCDVYGSEDCSKTVTVKNGTITTTIGAMSAIALDAAATEASHADSSVATDPSDPTLTVTSDATLPDDTTMTVYYKNPNAWDKVYIYYGLDNDWSAATNIAMTDLGNGYWSYDIKTGGKSAQVCFTDGSGNWDNNNSANYQLAEGITKATVSGVGDIRYDDPSPASQQTRIVVHYRAPSDNQDRKLWIWGTDASGNSAGNQWYDWTGEDCWGKVAELTFDGSFSTMGLIVSTTDWSSKIGQADRTLTIGADGTAEVWIDASNYDGTGDDPATQTTQPSDYSCKASTVDVTIHYYRNDGLYYNAADTSTKIPQWDIWTWNGNTNGFSALFSSHDDFGEVATATFKNYKTVAGTTSDFGVIARYGKDSWTKQTANLNIPSDAIVYDQSTGTAKAEIWLMQDDDTVYTAQPSQATVLSTAEIATMNTISGKFSNTADLTADDVTVTDADGKSVDVSDVKVDGTTMTITTKDDLDVAGAYTVATKENGSATATAGAVVRTDAFDKQYAYDGDDLGATWSAKSTTFKLWAPTATSVSVVFYADDTTADAAESSSTPMTQADNVWSVTVPGDLADTAYTYRVTFADGTVNDSPDPYATAAVVNGNRSVVLSDDEKSIDDFDRMDPFTGGAADAVVAETDIRDITKSSTSGVSEANRGKYLGLTETGTTNSTGQSTGLDYLKELGITHVQLQPFFDYASVDETKALDDSNYNWGYDPENYDVPEGSYSSDATNPSTRITEAKDMIKTLHDNGLRVIMDVVYNHVADEATSAFNLTVPGYYFRYDSNGNLTSNSGCGNDTASERAMMRKYIVDSVTYWAKNYNVDGFRFDLMGLTDLETMKEVRAALDKIDPTILIVGEGWDMDTNNDKSTMSIQPNAYELNTDDSTVSFFNDSIRDGLKGSVFSSTDTGFVSGKGDEEELIANNMLGCQNGDQYSASAMCSNGNANVKYANSSQIVQYAEIHDNMTLYDKLRASVPTDSEETTAKRAMLADSAVLLATGVSEIQLGQEFLRSKGGNDNSYNAGDSVNELDWDLLGQQYNGESAEYVKGLIALRKSAAALRTSDYDEINANSRILMMSDGVVAYQISDDDGTYVVMLNANSTPTDVVQAQGGDYQVLVDGDTVYAKDTSTGVSDSATDAATSSASTSAATADGTVRSAAYVVRNGDATATTTAIADTDSAQKTASTVTIDDGGSYTVPALSATVLYLSKANGGGVNGAKVNNAGGVTTGTTSVERAAEEAANAQKAIVSALAATGSNIGLIAALTAALLAGGLALLEARRHRGAHRG